MFDFEATTGINKKVQARWSVSGRKQSIACPVCRQPFEATATLSKAGDVGLS